MSAKVTTALITGLLLIPLAAFAEGEKKVIATGSSVSIEYTLKLDDGSTADSNVGEEPLVYDQGGEQILPALENELVGLSVGDEKEVTLSAEKGYGPMRPELFQEVEANMLPDDGRTVGSRLVGVGPNGSQQIVHVHEVKGDKIVLNLNHPLAGETLHFDVKVLAIE